MPQALSSWMSVAPRNGCKTGEAKITSGYNLPARYVIHTVGPVWRGGWYNEDELLAACYRHSLSLALRHQVRTIAFPAVSTGAYGFPLQRAAFIAADETERFFACYPAFDRIYFVCRGEEAVAAYTRAVEALQER